ncbi:MAG: RIP metalloprotease RseP [SAR324 cluster bacterium]|nr:RIP metalloprotease RseP [SAR324 cluster bacterium]
MISVISFIAILGFLIFIHEMGHYLAARHTGVHVQTFSIGFPPKMWGKKYGETEYVISWIPLGGYVKLLGQNMDDEDPQDPANYAAKTIFQRFYILVSGPAVNLLFAFLFMPLVYVAGISMPKYLLDPAIVNSVQENSFAQKIGLREGDEIVAVNGNEVRSWEEVHTQFGNINTATVALDVDRKGYLHNVTGSIEALKEQGAGWIPRISPVIGGFSEVSPVQQSGLQIGDRVVRINGLEVNEWRDISRIIQQSQPVVSESDAEIKHTGITVVVEVDRNGETTVAEITPYYNKTTKSYLLGMTVEQTRKAYSLWTSIKMGTERLIFITTMTFNFLGKLFVGEGSFDDLGGPLRIGMVIGDAVEKGLADVFFMMAVISLQLGIFNLLPIPVLDGGHIFFLGIEKLKGSPLSAVLRERTQMIGFAILMFFMIAVTYNDILQLR